MNEIENRKHIDEADLGTKRAIAAAWGSDVICCGPVSDALTYPQEDIQATQYLFV
jgi:hypothetical protein